MAAFDTTPAQSFNAGFAGRIGTAISTSFAAIQSWNAKRATRATLSKLTDRELADIGLMRVDIAEI